MITVFDFETTSLYIATLEITQFAYTILDNNFKQIETQSFCVKANIDDASIASKITGLKYDFLQKHGKTQEEFLTLLKEVYNKSDYLVAHNGKKFDFLILNRLLNVDCEKEKQCIDTIKDLSILSIENEEDYKQDNDFYTQSELKKDYNKLRHLAQEILRIHIDKNTMHDASVDVFYLTSILQTLYKQEKLFLNNTQKTSKLKTYRVFFNDKQMKFTVKKDYSELKPVMKLDQNEVPIFINGRQEWEELRIQKTDLMLEKMKKEWMDKYGIINGKDYLFRLEEEYQKDKTSPFAEKIVEWCGIGNKHKTYYKTQSQNDDVCNN